MKFFCPACDAVIEAPVEPSGDYMPCPSCDTEIAIPGTPVGPGTNINGFKVIKRIGGGGMGTVYLAEQTTMGRLVALKVLPSSLTQDITFSERFMSEVRMQGALNHPNIATAYDAGKYGDIYYLAMEHFEGLDLFDLIEKEGLLEERMALRIAGIVATGLAYAWDKQEVVHRDIKPSNIFLCHGNEVKILDLGVSVSKTSLVTQPSTAEMVLGTPHYMPPEQAETCSLIDIRGDIYSLGATLYHMLGGRPPFAEKSLTEIVPRQMQEKAAALKVLNPKVTPQAVRLIETMMARDPAHRHQDWQQCINDIRLVKAGSIPRTRRPPTDSLLLQVPPTDLHRAPDRTVSPRGKKGARVLHRLAMVALCVSMVALMLYLYKWPASRETNQAPSPNSSFSFEPPFAVPDPLGTGMVSSSNPRLLSSKEGVERDALGQQFKSLMEQTEEGALPLPDILQRLQEIQQQAAQLSMPELALQSKQARELTRVQYDHRTRELVKKLSEKAIDHIQTNNYEAAIALFLDYSGSFAEATRNLRRKQAALIEEDLHQVAYEQFKKLSDSLVKSILDTRSIEPALLEARKALESPSHTHWLSAIREVVEELTEAQKVEEEIVASFARQVGKEILVALKRRGTKRMLIRGVTESVIEASEVLVRGKGSITYFLTIDHLAMKEKLHRLKHIPGDATQFSLGVLALESGQKNMAYRHFSEGNGRLAKTLASELEPER